jgi:Tfp pilus assembly protein PilO
MTGRDRMVLIVILAVAVIGAAWLLVVSPERKKAAELGTRVASAQTQLASAEGQLQNARAAQQQYASAYSAIVSLGKAVPASQEVPSLIYQLEQASNNKKVEFASIVSAAGATTSGPSSPAATAAAASAGFTQMPFTFVFNGTFVDLEHLFEQLQGFTVHNTAGLHVSGRLLTLQSVKLAPQAQTQNEAGKPAGTSLTGTIAATAYVLPASQGLTGGATASSPAGSATSASTGASSSPTTPAVARVTP